MVQICMSRRKRNSNKDREKDVEAERPSVDVQFGCGEVPFGPNHRRIDTSQPYFCGVSQNLNRIRKYCAYIRVFGFISALHLHDDDDDGEDDEDIYDIYNLTKKRCYRVHV